jgi:hypothetical protein
MFALRRFTRVVMGFGKPSNGYFDDRHICAIATRKTAMKLCCAISR